MGKYQEIKQKLLFFTQLNFLSFFFKPNVVSGKRRSPEASEGMHEIAEAQQQDVPHSAGDPQESGERKRLFNR